MILTGSLLGILLGLASPDQPAPAPDQTARTGQPVPALAAPACSIAVKGPGRKVKAVVQAPDTGFEGRARLHLSGKGFMHDDLRPVHIGSGKSLSLQVPNVPLPNPLRGELTILDATGATVCEARL